MLPTSVKPRCLARVCSSAVNGAAASTDAPTIGATCNRVLARAAVWADVLGDAVVEGAGEGAGAVVVVAVVDVPCGAAEDWAELAGGVMAEGSSTSLALVQAPSASAASNDTVVIRDRLICLKTP
ncbi:exported hypothetical protein [Mesorhizobium sp. ORS 3359]|nr:exported hypothetical protein [Mesorhizobium sp. ORS 3359]